MLMNQLRKHNMFHNMNELASREHLSSSRRLSINPAHLFSVLLQISCSVKIMVLAAAAAAAVLKAQGQREAILLSHMYWISFPFLHVLVLGDLC
jgi:hypothetical protein